MKARKKPLVVEANRWFINGDHPLDGPSDREGKIVRYFRTPSQDRTVPCEHCGRSYHDHGWIDTSEGGHRVCPGDWVITGVRGEHYPCKPDIFDMTYEVV